jgi:tRNA threonylcarbamoyl adenosine modification protein YeaZ
MAGVTEAVEAIVRWYYLVTRMLVLALDTTTRTGSCALARDGRTVLEQTGDGTRSQAARLPADLMGLLSLAELPLADVDVFAVATGPGSFTGLRVGIATMQGLSFAMGKPLVGISALDALAVAGGNGRVLTWVDAWRGEVYSACYQGGIQVDEPIVAPPASQPASAPPGLSQPGNSRVASYSSPS